MIYAEADTANQYTWSKSRSRETDNCIILWDKGWGNNIPTNAPEAYRIAIENLSKKAAEFYSLEMNKLGFVKPQGSQLDKI